MPVYVVDYKFYKLLTRTTNFELWSGLVGLQAIFIFLCAVTSMWKSPRVASDRIQSERIAVVEAGSQRKCVQRPD